MSERNDSDFSNARIWIERVRSNNKIYKYIVVEWKGKRYRVPTKQIIKHVLTEKGAIA